MLEPGERASIRTGIALEIPAGSGRPRRFRAPGLAMRHGISVVNAPGLIDAGYRGEVQVLLLNTDRRSSFSAGGRRADRAARARPRRDSGGAGGRASSPSPSAAPAASAQAAPEPRPRAYGAALGSRPCDCRNDLATAAGILVQQIHGRVQAAHHRRGEQRVDAVDGPCERRALGQQRAGGDDGHNVAPAERPPGVAQQHVLAAAQLTVGRVHLGRLHRALIERLVLGAHLQRAERRGSEPVGLLDRRQPGGILLELRRAPERERRADPAQIAELRRPCCAAKARVTAIAGESANGLGFRSCRPWASA